MIAIVASRRDAEAVALADAWRARLIDAADLCRPGWRFDVAAPGDGTCVVAGEPVRVAELTGVLTRRPAVLAAELVEIAADDRDYAAAEIQAFLTAWLAALPCRVVNRPSARSLSGPAWTSAHWEAAARRAGLAWDRHARGDHHDVHACGDRCFGECAADELDAVRRLAREANVHLLAVRFVGDVAVAASTMPPLRNAVVRAALREDLA
jgi:hypothetical protein